MAPTTLKLTNRSPKQPIKKLPESIELGPDATVEDVKKMIAKEARIGDFNRVGLYDPSTKKTLKNRRARVVDEEGVASAGEVLVKDLGPQISWQTVFVIEYLGPILIHAAVVAARPYLYKNADGDMSQTQWLTFGMIVLHFVKREYETLFVHKFSANTMPFFNVFKNSFFYWAISGALCAYFIYSPTSLAAQADIPIIDALGAALYLFSETGNALVHRYLSSLRSTGGTERKIPVGYGFGLVTCPNYMFEVLSWVGIILVSRDWTVALFIAIGAAQMFDWAKGKERAYRKEFGDSYKKKRFVMLPGLL
ncbi:steroid alpha reductase family protein [Ilyonectria robusta]|uniref:steroid alpha reductase family protein n=1 Tax=Ilyonectria robusta TaxID=1079257 RepID=UPI001E8D9EBD|nr:steroid alpha reductase family protein [Ilyonectria robusta]KAH8735033.1 steroid alpha reductase family protein [Ilyonectria robusta]